MSISSAPSVNKDQNLAFFVDTESFSDPLVEDLVCSLYFYEVISASEFRSRMQETPPAYQHYVASPEGRRQFLNILVREKVLLVEARKSGMEKEEA